MRVDIPFVCVVNPLSWTEIPTIIGIEACIWKEITNQKMKELFNIDLVDKQCLDSKKNNTGQDDIICAENLSSDDSSDDNADFD